MSTSVTLCGRLTRDPELIFSNKGNAIAKFSIVTSRRVKDAATGQWSDADTSFYDCTAFGAMAENICESAQKGTSVVATGNMHQESWEKDGETKRAWRVNVDDFAVSCKWNKVTVSDGASSNSNGYSEKPPF